MVIYNDGSALEAWKKGEFNVILYGTDIYGDFNNSTSSYYVERYPVLKEVDRLTVAGDRGKIGLLYPVEVAPRKFFITTYLQFRSIYTVTINPDDPDYPNVDADINSDYNITTPEIIIPEDGTAFIDESRIQIETEPFEVKPKGAFAGEIDYTQFISLPPIVERHYNTEDFHYVGYKDALEALLRVVAKFCDHYDLIPCIAPTGFNLTGIDEDKLRMILADVFIGNNITVFGQP